MAYDKSNKSNKSKSTSKAQPAKETPKTTNVKAEAYPPRERDVESIEREKAVEQERARNETQGQSSRQARDEAQSGDAKSEKPAPQSAKGKAEGKAEEKPPVNIKAGFASRTTADVKPDQVQHPDQDVTGPSVSARLPGGAGG